MIKPDMVTKNCFQVQRYFLIDVHWWTQHKVCEYCILTLYCAAISNTCSLSKQVVCRQLGFAGGVVRDRDRFGRGSGDILLDDVTCTGSESSLVECAHRPWGLHDCSHKEDVAVSCR